MINEEYLLGLVFILLAVGLMLFYLFFNRKGSNTRLRDIPALKRLQQSIGLTVEEGKRMHISLGSANLLSGNAASSLAGFSTLERLAQFSMVSDKPPVVTSGTGLLAILSQDTLRYVYRYGNALEQYKVTQSQMSGAAAYAYAMGTWPVIKTENVLSNILIGNFGPEIGLITEAVESNSFSLAASDALAGQAVLFATADEPLIGEELFAAPAYIKPEPFHLASLQAQDVLRWLLIGALVIGAVLKIIEGLLGITIL